MNRILSFSLALFMAGSLAASANAAAVSKLLVGNFSSISSDFAGVGPAPVPFYLYMNFDDAGALGGGVLKTQAGAVLANVTTAGSGWILGDGGQDTLQVTAVTDSPGNFITFTMTAPASTINSTSNASGTNVEPFFNGNAILPAAITFGNFAGLGYSGQITAVPEPSSMALLFGSVAGIGLLRRRRKA